MHEDRPQLWTEIIFQLIFSPFTKLSVVSHVLNEFEHLVQMQEMEHLRIVEKPWVCVCKDYVKFEGENNSTII